MTRNQPPVPARRESVRELHGDRRVDGYAWLRDLDDPAVLAHLRAERDHYDASTAHLRPLVESLAEAMSSRLPESERSASWRHENFSYYMKTPTGSEYAQLVRTFDPSLASHTTKSAVDSSVYEGFSESEQILLDPAVLAEGSSYVELGVTLVSPDERLLAYSVDRVGDEVYELRFRDLGTGEDLAERVPHTYYGGAWSADSRTFFYTVHDQQYRPFQVWRHTVGTDVADDVLVLEEPDQQYELSVRTCRSGDVIVLHAENRDTSEAWLVDAHRPEQPPRMVEPRRRGTIYAVEHGRTGTGEDVVFVVTDDGAPEFRLMVAPLATPDRDHWVEMVPENPQRRLLDADAFDGYLVLTYRAMDSEVLHVTDLVRETSFDIEPGPVAGTIALEHNEMWHVDEITIAEESHIVPRRWYAFQLATGNRRLLHERTVPAYDPADYISEQRFVPADDGSQILVTLVRHRTTPLDGTAPCLLYGYGAYEAVFEAEFDAALTVLLDRGVVYAHAHIRGGGEGGRRWWQDGRLANKQNTFGDHIAVAKALGAGVVDGSRIVTRGLSAGGLLQGAVFTQAPQLWAGVIAEVPFVDVVNTMLDPSIPLTVNEWDEWGNPRDPEQYGWIVAYSPYDNIPPAGGRPPLLATGALHDPRVMVWEPAKWVAALRETDPEWADQCLFRCELGPGAHVGPSGRFAHTRYEAEIYAWALERFGLAGS